MVAIMGYPAHWWWAASGGHLNSGKKVVGQFRDLRQCGLEQKMSPVQQMDLGVGKIGGERFGTGRAEYFVTTAPNRQQGNP